MLLYMPMEMIIEGPNRKDIYKLEWLDGVYLLENNGQF